MPWGIAGVVHKLSSFFELSYQIVQILNRFLKVLIPLDDPELQPLMTKTLRRYFNALRSNEKHIKDVENYLYGTMQNLFANYWNKKAARRYYDEHPEEEKPADDSWLYY